MTREKINLADYLFITMPDVNERRPLEGNFPKRYREPDDDYVSNNIAACVWFLNNAVAIKEILEKAVLK